MPNVGSCDVMCVLAAYMPVNDAICLPFGCVDGLLVVISAVFLAPLAKRRSPKVLWVPEEFI